MAVKIFDEMKKTLDNFFNQRKIVKRQQEDFS